MMACFNGQTDRSAAGRADALTGCGWIRSDEKTACKEAAALSQKPCAAMYSGLIEEGMDPSAARDQNSPVGEFTALMHF